MPYHPLWELGVHRAIVMTGYFMFPQQDSNTRGGVGTTGIALGDASVAFPRLGPVGIAVPDDSFGGHRSQ